MNAFIVYIYIYAYTHTSVNHRFLKHVFLLWCELVVELTPGCQFSIVIHPWTLVCHGRHSPNCQIIWSEAWPEIWIMSFAHTRLGKNSSTEIGRTASVSIVQADEKSMYWKPNSRYLQPWTTGSMFWWFFGLVLGPRLKLVVFLREKWCPLFYTGAIWTALDSWLNMF